jgi:hypothetical protein
MRPGRELRIGASTIRPGWRGSRLLLMNPRAQFGFAPLRACRICLGAALAAKRFQPTLSHSEAEAALPALVACYRLLWSEAVARLELNWWQPHRERSGPYDFRSHGRARRRAYLWEAHRSSRHPAVRPRARRGYGLSRRAQRVDQGRRLGRDPNAAPGGLSGAEIDRAELSCRKLAAPGPLKLIGSVFREDAN